jgi:hypothetical protein
MGHTLTTLLPVLLLSSILLPHSAQRTFILTRKKFGVCLKNVIFYLFCFFKTVLNQKLQNFKLHKSGSNYVHVCTLIYRMYSSTWKMFMSHLQYLWRQSNVNIKAYIICINSQDPVQSVFFHTASSMVDLTLIMTETDRCWEK